MSFFSKQAFQEDEDSDIEYMSNNEIHTNWNLQSVISQHTTSSQTKIDTTTNNTKHPKLSNPTNISKSTNNQNHNIHSNTNTNSNTLSTINTPQTNNLRNLLPTLNEPSKKRKLDIETIDNDPYTQPLKKAKISDNIHHNTDKLLSTLKSRFKFSSFRNKQRIAIESCLNGNDVLLLMPTGSGKSICFQLPPLITNKLGIVISPLISLMKNHVDALKNNNINAVLFNSTVKKKDKQNILQLLQNKIKKLQQERKENISNISNEINDTNINMKEIEIFYTTPETLNSNMQLKSRLKSLHFLNGISLFAIDECHCISSWGHDFRPKYRLLNQIRNNFPNIPIMGVTATATKNVQIDIIQSLQLNNPNVIIGNFDRPNLYFKFKYYEHINTQQKQEKKPFNWKKFTKNKTEKTSVISTQNRIFAEDVKKFISENYATSCGIIYTFTRKGAEHIANYLHKHGNLSVAAYHAGFSGKQRSNIQQKWESNEIKIICSTNAFGMGIDKSDVRFIIHNVITKSIESYYQQIGRAGRDGKYAHIVCYYNYGMTNKFRKLIFDDILVWLKNMNKDKKWERGELKKCVQNSELYKRRIELLECVKIFAEGKRCRRKYMLEYFGSDVCRNNCNNNSEYKCCDYCDDSESIDMIIDGYSEKKKNGKNKKRYGRRKKGGMHYHNGKRGKRGKKNMQDVGDERGKGNKEETVKQRKKKEEVENGNDDAMNNIDENDKKFTFENVFGI